MPQYQVILNSNKAIQFKDMYDSFLTSATYYAKTPLEAFQMFSQESRLPIDFRDVAVKLTGK